MSPPPDEHDEPDEFLEAVDLSVRERGPSKKGPTLLRGGVMVLLLGLWSVGVFMWFSREAPTVRPETAEPLEIFPETALPAAEALPTALPSVVSEPPPRHSLQIQSDPPGATLLWKDDFQGVTPISLSGAKAGEGLLFQLSGYEPLRMQVSDRHLQAGTLQVTLSPLLAGVRVEVRPADSELFLNGSPLKLPTDGLLNLPLREQQITAKARGYVSETLTFTPAKAYERKVVLHLKPLPTPTPVLVPGQESPALKEAVVEVQGLEMIRPTFPLEATLGSPRGSAGRQSNEGVFSVKLSREFRISKMEISNAQFRKFKAAHNSGRFQGVDLNADSLPVVNVGWQDAAAFCNWLSAQEGLPPAYVEKEGRWEFQEKPGTGYRLPTEAEWEGLARLEQKQALFGWGGEMPPPKGKVNLAGKESEKMFGAVIADFNDTFAGPAPVGEAGTGPLGLVGLFGNVREWVQDAYSISPNSRRVIENPLNSAAGKFHVIKGASWQDAGLSDIRIARRRYNDQPAADLGFRVARYIEP